ncbi:MAG TPA: GNAT family N-acetyltransferase [Actinophytocola sp.]|uniref:GNAT family N-acetyltransferase n=1 Tax=Actinophytocola sp. TaxID=1872138 RepID=UPI002DDD559B|nr:GNAT family N-acetyltransferase [Actinophytocola sp.]HEV2780520.1 GNAT family N-acetyltransferase [Actinophytocola sp.]
MRSVTDFRINPVRPDRGSHLLETVPTLDAIGDHELDPLTAGRTFYVSRPWLKAVERRHGDRIAYLTCRDGKGTLRGVCPVYWDAGSCGYYDPFDHFLHRSGAEFNRDDWSPAYLVGSRAAYSCEFLVDPTMAPDQRRDVLALLLDSAAAHAGETGAASLSALYLNPRGAAQLGEVLDDDRACYIAGASSVLDVPWSSMEEYVTAMGRGRGTNIRREMRVFAGAGYTVAGGRLSDWIDVAADLFSQLERRYGHEASAADEAAELRTLAACADEHSHVLVIKDGADVVGAMLLFVWEGVVYIRSAGFNYAATKRAFEYFNLVYETIRFAIRHGYHRIDMGMATYRAKLARGARLEPRWGVTLSRTADSPLSNDEFNSWDRLRRAAVRAADPSMLEQAQLP